MITTLAHLIVRHAMRSALDFHIGGQAAAIRAHIQGGLFA